MFKSPISLGLSSLLCLGLCTLVCKHTSLLNYRKSPVLQEVSDVAEQSSVFLMLSFWSYVSFTIYLVHFLSSWPIEKTEKTKQNPNLNNIQTIIPNRWHLLNIIGIVANYRWLIATCFPEKQTLKMFSWIQWILLQFRWINAKLHVLQSNLEWSSIVF